MFILRQAPLVPAGTALAAATSGAGVDGAAIGVGDCSIVDVQVNVTAVGGTTPSLQVFIDASCDGGATWTQIAAGTAITAVGNQMFSVGIGSANNAGLGNQIRARYTLTGTTPSATFGVQAVAKG